MNLKENTISPAHYYPFISGVYSTAPGLHKLGTDFGNAEADQYIFQVDKQWPAYRKNVLECRQEGIDKYYKTHKLNENTGRVLTEFIIGRLLSEYPSVFQVKEQAHGFLFTNQLSKEEIRFDQNFCIQGKSQYRSALDALASQVQEDIAIWQLKDNEDWMSMIHLCAPNHWAPADKIGKPFSSVHQPVAGMDKMRQRYQPMLKTLIKGGSFVRFAWGLSTDNRLNHHPVPPTKVDIEAWQGRSFDPDNPVLYVRVERQTLSGFPETNAVLFTIRTYFEEVTALKDEQLRALRDTLNTMSAESLQYKGLAESMVHIQVYLHQLISKAKG